MQLKNGLSAAGKKFYALRWFILSTVLFAGGLYWYFGVYTATDATSSEAFYVVETVDRGAVSSGIQTTGEIEVAQKLDLNVYKQSSRISAVNVANGSHVSEGDVLLTFDKSDAYVTMQSAQVSVASAQLGLQEAQSNSTDINTQITSKQSQIATLEKAIADAADDRTDAWRAFLNDQLSIDPDASDYTRLYDEQYPTLGGTYRSDTTGTYTVEVYGSKADSGFSYRYSGLESGQAAIVFGKALDLGTRGLTIVFPTTARSGDTWVVSIPDTTSAGYQDAYQDYQDTIASIDEQVRTNTVSLENARVELADLEETDTSAYRDLTVEESKATLASAQQRLSDSYSAIDERDIVAPFSGTIQDMENVVEGATPTGGDSDTIQLGTLVSDEYLTTFTLSASDVAKVSVGQKVNVTITSYQDEPIYTAAITEISSLPEQSGVAQYMVKALLEYDPNTASSTEVLREGMLADIEIVQEENTDALRLPTSAITYEQGVPKVTVVDSLTTQQQQQMERMGIIRDEDGSLPTYTKTVTLGLVGTYYVEVLDGVEEGDKVLTASVSSAATESVVGQSFSGPGGGGGGGQPPSGG